MQIGVQLLLGEEGGAVEPLELLAAGVVLPVRPGNAQEFERADLAGVGNMRAPAEINKFTLPVEAEARVLLEIVVDVLDLVTLAEVAAEGAGFACGPLEALERLGFLDD